MLEGRSTVRAQADAPGLDEAKSRLSYHRVMLEGRADVDSLQLYVRNMVVPVLTGVYSEETKQPQPLRITVAADLDLPADRFASHSPLAMSKDYLDLKRAVTIALPATTHFTLVEAVADHICETILAADRRVARVQVNIVKLAISLDGEEIGISMVRNRMTGAG